MKPLRVLLAFAAILPSALFASSLSINARSGTADGFTLIGPDARQQLIVTQTPSEGHPIDVTGKVKFEVQPAGVIEFLDAGFMKAVKDGSAQITAKMDGSEAASIQVTVERADKPLPVNFSNEVVPILTKYGCNGGGCHGKSGGQNGFRLSLLGYEPWNDYEYLMNEGRGRRIFPAAPRHSLLLTKSTGEIPHGGGARIDLGSHDYEFLVRWIEQGTPFGSEDDPTIDRIQVFPKQRVGESGQHQQLSVTAHYSDGTTRDVTRAVQYEANQKEMAEVTEHGLGRNEKFARQHLNHGAFSGTCGRFHRRHSARPAGKLTGAAEFRRSPHFRKT